MKRLKPPYGWVIRWLVFPLVTMLALSASGGETEKKGEREEATSPKPNITITLVPPESLQSSPDKLDKIAGKVSGVNVEECKVVIFAFGKKWDVQPSQAKPYTDIDQEGKWENDTHGSYQYAALLVKASYKPPVTTETLPKVGGDVLAIDIIPSITITRVPPATLLPGPVDTDTIAGKARAVNVKEYKVVLFAFGDAWYVQPFTASPYTEIDEEGTGENITEDTGENVTEGTWENVTHGGHQYAALLVKDSYKPPNTTGVLPKVDGKKVLAIAKAKPKKE